MQAFPSQWKRREAVRKATRTFPTLRSFVFPPRCHGGNVPELDGKSVSTANRVQHSFLLVVGASCKTETTKLGNV